MEQQPPRPPRQPRESRQASPVRDPRNPRDRRNPRDPRRVLPPKPERPAVKPARSLRIVSVIIGLGLAMTALTTIYSVATSIPGTSSAATGTISTTVSTNALTPKISIGDPAAMAADPFLGDPSAFAGLSLHEGLTLPDGVTASETKVDVPVGTSTKHQILHLVAVTLSTAIWILVLFRLNRFWNNVMRADVEQYWDVKLVRSIGWSLIAAWVLGRVAGIADFYVLRHSVLADAISYTHSLATSLFDFTVLFFGLGVLALSAVVRRGADLQAEADATI